MSNVAKTAVRQLVLQPLSLSSCTYFLQEVITRRFTMGHLNHGDDLSVSQIYSLPWNYNPVGGIISTAETAPTLTASRSSGGRPSTS